MASHRRARSLFKSLANRTSKDDLDLFTSRAVNRPPSYRHGRLNQSQGPAEDPCRKSGCKSDRIRPTQTLYDSAGFIRRSDIPFIVRTVQDDGGELFSNSSFGTLFFDTGSSESRIRHSENDLFVEAMVDAPVHMRLPEENLSSLPPWSSGSHLHDKSDEDEDSRGIDIELCEFNLNSDPFMRDLRQAELLRKESDKLEVLALRKSLGELKTERKRAEQDNQSRESSHEEVGHNQSHEFSREDVGQFSSGFMGLEFLSASFDKDFKSANDNRNNSNMGSLGPTCSGCYNAFDWSDLSNGNGPKFQGQHNSSFPWSSFDNRSLSGDVKKSGKIEYVAEGNGYSAEDLILLQQIDDTLSDARIKTKSPSEYQTKNEMRQSSPYEPKRARWDEVDVMSFHCLDEEEEDNVYGGNRRVSDKDQYPNYSAEAIIDKNRSLLDVSCYSQENVTAEHDLLMKAIDRELYDIHLLT